MSNMKTLILLFAFSLQLFAATGLWNGTAFTLWNGVAQTSWNGTSISCAASGATYLVNQNFEGAGYDNSETWTESNAVWNEDYTATVLTGSQSLYAISTTVSRTLDSPVFATTSDIWFYLQFQLVAAPTANTLLIQFRNNVTGLATVRFRTGSKFRVEDAGQAHTSSDSTGTLSTGVKYHCWVHYIAGGGTDSTISCAISTDGTKPTSGNYFVGISNGVGSLGCDRARVYCDSSGSAGNEMIYDRFLADNAAIGDNP